MHQEERLLAIFTYLKENQKMSIHKICEQLHVSRDTARRDILKLLEQGTVTRTYGGISLPVLKNSIKEYRERLQEGSAEKERLAQKAYEFIQPNGHYFFDVSTTVRFLAQKIDKPIWVWTHSLDNVEVLSEKDHVQVSTIGGRLQKKDRFFHHPNCSEYIRTLHFNAAFLGTATINHQGLYYTDEDDAFIKKEAIAQADCTIVLAEADKFNATSYHKAAGWAEVDILVTDAEPPQDMKRILSAHKVQVIII